MSQKNGYRQAGGVDTAAADQWVELLQRSGAASGANAELSAKLRSGIGDYAAVYAQSEDQWVAASCDGVGTKLLWTLQGLGTAESLAQDLLAMNVNDLLCVGARPTLFLDYLAVSSKKLLEKNGLLAQFISGLHKLCSQTGQLLVGGETAQMPDLYQEGHFDLAGFSIGFLKPTEHLSVEGIRAGQKVWAWKSSGPHSNGYSWLRKLFSAEKDSALIRQHFMAPTQLYVNEFLALRAELSKTNTTIRAAFHITGSGYLNLLRAQPKGRTIGFDLSGLRTQDAPAWFAAIKERSGAGWEELYTSFNGGYGMMLLLDAADSAQHESLFKGAGLVCLGDVIDQAEVRIPGLSVLT